MENHVDILIVGAGVVGCALARELSAIDPNTITPLEALNLLYKLKKMAANG